MERYCMLWRSSIENTSNYQKCIFKQVNGRCNVKSGYIVLDNPEQPWK